MNCSRSCFRRLLGILSLGITNRSRSGTFSPISCISPSTTHHSDLSSGFLNIADGENLDRRRLRCGRSEPASVRAFRNCAAAIWRNLWGGWILLTREIIGEALESGRPTGKGLKGLVLKQSESELHQFANLVPQFPVNILISLSSFCCMQIYPYFSNFDYMPLKFFI